MRLRQAAPGPGKPQSRSLLDLNPLALVLCCQSGFTPLRQSAVYWVYAEIQLKFESGSRAWYQPRCKDQKKAMAGFHFGLKEGLVKTNGTTLT